MQGPGRVVESRTPAQIVIFRRRSSDLRGGLRVLRLRQFDNAPEPGVVAGLRQPRSFVRLVNQTSRHIQAPECIVGVERGYSYILSNT